MSTTLPLKTYVLSTNNRVIELPEDITENCYHLIYYHSKLELTGKKPTLHPETLYEYWAFDRKKSWHIWKRDNDWICTIYDTQKDKSHQFIEQHQLLRTTFGKKLDKLHIVIYERIAYDEDGQAYIAYACPIRLE